MKSDVGAWRAGAVLGSLVGVIVALQALGGAPIGATRAGMIVVLGIVAQAALAGAVLIPAALVLVGRTLQDGAAGAPDGSRGPLAAWLRPAVLVAFAAAAGFLAHVARGAAPAMLPWRARSLLVLLLVVTAVLWAFRRVRTARSTAALAGVSVAVIGLALGPSDLPDLLRLLDRGDRSAPRVVAPAAPGRPNILFVVLDTTRADHLSLYGYPRRTTPFLDELAREALVYERAVSAAPWTLPSHASMFTGQPPAVHGASKDRFWLADESITLAEALRDAGYSTAAFTSASMVSSRLNMHQGFEHFYEIYRNPRGELTPPLHWAWVLPRRLLPERTHDKGARLTVEGVRRWLDGWSGDATQRPFFLFVNLFEAHLPYEPPGRFRELFQDGIDPSRVHPLLRDGFSHRAIYRAIGLAEELTDADYEPLRAAYDACLAYQDERLRELVAELEERGLLDDTILVVTSDHGENLGDHGGLLGHKFSLHQTLVRVPLLVRAPGRFEAGVRYPGVVTTTSLFPTLLEVADASPAGGSPSLLPGLPRRTGDPPLPFAVSEYGLPVFDLYRLVSDAPGVSMAPFAVRQSAIQDARWKLILRSSGETTLFDLGADPDERGPMAGAGRPEATRLAERMASWFSELPSPTGASSQVGDLDEETREALRAMGYIE